MDLRGLFNQAVPVNARSFLGDLFGNKQPITENHLTPEDLEALKFAIQKSQQKGNEGVIGYGDYAPKWIDNGFGSPNHGLSDMVRQSYTDPAYRMETTLGMANYKPHPDGGYLVTDNYNWGATRSRVDEERQKGLLHMLQLTRGTGLSGLFNLMGNMYGSTDNEQGSPVRIRIK